MGLTSLNLKKQQFLLSAMRSDLFCSESHLAGKTLRAEKSRSYTLPRRFASPFFTIFLRKVSKESIHAAPAS